MLNDKTLTNEGKSMNRIAEVLEAKLQTLDEARAAELARRVQAVIDAMDLHQPIDPMLGVDNGYPVGYFAETAGALAGEDFDRPDQGELQDRDDW